MKGEVHPQAAKPNEHLDIVSLARFCALVEIGDLIAAPAITEHLYQALLWALERGVLFSHGWVFLIPRVLGVAATLNRWWDKAEAYFQTAIEAAASVGARPELGRTYLDYARMLAARGSMSDYRHAIELVTQAGSIFHELGMQPLAQRAAQLTEALQARMPLALRQHASYLDNFSKQEVDIFLHIARSRTNFLG